MLDVLLAGPHHLDGAIDLLGDAHGRDHHVGLELAAKTAAEQVVVDDHLLDRQAGRLRRLRLHAGHDLRAGPDLAQNRA